MTLLTSREQSVGIEYSIDTEARTVRMVYLRESDADELMATMRVILRSPTYQQGFGFLIDKRAVGAPTHDFVDRILAFLILLREQVRGSRFAVLTRVPDAYGKARMAQTHSPSAPVRVAAFQRLQDAERWLCRTAPREDE
jgi:hypothetical protein